MEKASRKVNLKVEYHQAFGSGDTQGLPGAVIRTEPGSAFKADQRLDDLELVGTALNRIVIQLVRDVDDGL